jgi:hypothetical protein
VTNVTAAALARALQRKRPKPGGPMNTRRTHDHGRDHHTSVPSSQAPLPQQASWTAPGQVVMGPNFYVWDESPKQAREWGVELANAWLARRR